jgi:hypothetical protein
VDFQDSELTFINPQNAMENPRPQQSNIKTGENGRKISAAAIGIAALSILFHFGCSKDPSPIPLSSNGVMENVTPRVDNFIASADSRLQAKNAGELTLDSATWYIEAALNRSSTQGWKEYRDLVTDTFRLSLAISNGTVNFSEALEAYNSLSDAIAPLTTEEQHVKIIDVVPTVNGSSLDLLTLATVVSGYDKGAPSTVYGTNDDYYYFAFGISSSCPCGTNPNSTSYCANKVIEQRINSANFHPISPGEYWYGVETWYVSTGTTSIPDKLYSWNGTHMADPNANNDGYRDTRLFSWRQGASQGGYCVQNTEMGFWTGNATSGTWSAIQFIKSTHCPTKLFSSCNIIGSGTTVVINNVSYVYAIHAGAFNYGYIGSAS